MKKNNAKRTALTLGIALVSAIAFFLQCFIGEASLHISLIGAGILFALVSGTPLCFFLADKLIEKRNIKDKKQNNKIDKN